MRATSLVKNGPTIETDTQDRSNDKRDESYDMDIMTAVTAEGDEIKTQQFSDENVLVIPDSFLGV